MFDRFFYILAWLERRPIFIVVQRSLFIVLPLILVGAFALSLRHFPSTVFTAFLDHVFGAEWTGFLDGLVSGTFGIVSLAVVCTFSGSMARIMNQTKSGASVSPIMAIVVVLSCFFVICAPWDNNSWDVVFSNGRGLLPSLLIAVTGCLLFLYLARLRFLQWSMGAVGHDPAVRDILTVFPAAAATIIIAALFRQTIECLGVTDFHAYVCDVAFKPFSNTGNNLGFSLSYTATSQIFWILGAHGPNLLFGVEENILVPAVYANQAAIAQGLQPSLVFTKPFFDLYTRIGGSGSTICLIMALLIRSRNQGVRKLCLFAMIPALCNVNEPLLYGIPLVLNPIYVIPFIVTPLLQTVTAYIATITGLVPYTSDTVFWTTPVLISGFVSTGSISGPVLQIVNVLMGIACYIPFVQLADKLRERSGEFMLENLKAAAVNMGFKSKGISILDIPGEPGRFAKALAGDLSAAMKKGRQLYLVYQPQVSEGGRHLSGVEALLRWKHPVYGNVSPEIIVTIAEEIGAVDRLGLLVMDRACRQRAAWKNIVREAFTMSVNVLPRQLTDLSFSPRVFDILQANGLTPDMIEIEITESSVLEPDENTLKSMEILHKEGIRIAIDDFGMGHSSLHYLRSFPISTIKIDRSLTLGDKRHVNRQIVKSVLELSRTLNIETIVEGVETIEQLNRFRDIGYMTFQGNLFSRPLTGECCTAFILEFSRNN